MEEVIFAEFSKGVSENVIGWNFKQVYPALSLDNDFEIVGNKEKKEYESECMIWISRERLKIPVGRKKMIARIFLWFDFKVESGLYDCSVGILPDIESLDDKAIEILQTSTRGKFFDEPYYHLVTQKEYRDIFLKQCGVEKKDLEEVKQHMKSSVIIVEKNLVIYLEGAILDRKSRVCSNGWAVLLRARSGSL